MIQQVKVKTIAYGFKLRIQNAFFLFNFVDQENDQWNQNIIASKSNVNKNETKPKKDEIANGGHNLNLHSETRETAPDDSVTAEQNETHSQQNRIKSKNILVEVPTKAILMDGIESLASPEKRLDRTGSEHSSTSIGSIEQRLAAMISPVKTAAEVRAEKEGN